MYCFSGNRERVTRKNINDMCYSKPFLKAMQPLLSDKIGGYEKTNLKADNKIIENASKNAEVLNNFFSNIVKDLKISNYSKLEPFAKNINDSTLKAILKYINHPSILVLQCKFINNETNHKKASQDSDIPVKILKTSSNICSEFERNGLNGSIKSCKFSPILKLTDITPIHKKGKQDLKKKFRPITIMPKLFKISERSMLSQMSNFF